jgi:hypothetical protein
MLSHSPNSLFERLQSERLQGIEESTTFDRIVGRNYLGRFENPRQALEQLRSSLSTGGRIVLAESVPRESTKLSELLRKHCEVEPSLLDSVEGAEEEAIIATEGAGAISPDALSKLTEGLGQEPGLAKLNYHHHRENRVLDSHLVTQWFAPGSTGPLASALALTLDSSDHKRLNELALSCLGSREVEWRFAVAYVVSE